MSETPFKIEHHVPMPQRPSRIPDLPLHSMKVGDSFLIEDVAQVAEKEGAIRQRMYRYQRSNPPKRFSLVRDKEVEGAMRLFRIDDLQSTN